MDSKIDKPVLMEKLDFAIRQMVNFFLERYGEEEIYAMSFRMHSETNAVIEWRYLCEAIVQTKNGYEESMRKWKEQMERRGEACGDLLEYKYSPEEYKYTANGLDGFREVQAYLRKNGLDFEEYEAMEDVDEQDAMYEELMEEAFEIETILAEAIANLRREKLFTGCDGKEFYVFPYVGEDDLPGNFIPLAEMMNQGLDITEYIEYWNC